MKKRRLILGDYDTAEDGLFTLSACKITKGSQVQSFVSVPGRYAPIDTSTLLTDGQPYYGSAALDATLESSEGTRDERLARVSGMVNALDGRSLRIIHPDHPERYLVGRVQVRPEYNDPAHCAVRVSAVCEPWLYNAQETEVQANLPHAEIHKIGGVTRKCTNLCAAFNSWNASNASVSNGVLTQVKADTKPTLEFIVQAYNNSTFLRNVSNLQAITAIGRYSWQFVKDNSFNTLVFGHNGASTDIKGYTDISHLIDGKAYTLTVEITNVTQGSFSWRDATINEGSAALPYEPYFEGLRSAPVTKVESVGVNLFDPAPIGTKTFIGLTYTTEGSYVKINGTKANGANIHIMTAPNMTLPAGTYTVSVRMISGTVSGIEANGGVFFGINQNTYGQRTTPGVSKVGDVGVRTFTLSEPTLVSSFDIAPDYASVGAVFDNAVFACQFEKSDTATEFKPYTRNILPIPEAVQALDGYGDGVSESVYNYIDFETKQFVKRVGKVDLGTLTWVYSVNSTIFYSAGLAGSAKGGGRVVCDKFTSVVGLAAVQSTDKSIGLAGDKTLYAHDSAYTDAATFKAAMSGVMLYYELANPVVTDISDLLSGVNTIPAEEGGTLTMVNPYGYEVPHEVTYYLDGESPQQVELVNAGRLAVVPVVTVKGEVTLSYGNITQALSTGTYTLPWLYLTPDKGPLLPASHIVTCSGGGSVTFTYREAVLAE